MMTITISDRDEATNVLSFDLKDLLSVLGEDGTASKWTVRGAEALGDGTGDLYAAENRGEFVSGAELQWLASKIDQVVEGEFRAYEQEGSTSPWLIMRAVDSSSWDVATVRNDVLNRFRARFRDVDEVGDRTW